MKKTIYIFVCSAFYAAIIWASTPHIRQYSRFGDLQRGKAQGVSITSLGELILAPTTKRIIDTSDPFVWCAVSDSRDNVYLGTGNEGRLYKVSAEGDTSLFFDAPELGIYCLSVDDQNNVFAGTSPNGKIYRIEPNGKSQVFADPPDTYIWALTFDKQGKLYVATGQSGSIYAIDRGGQSKLVFDSEQTHIRCLTIDSNGQLFAGSGDNGYIYRVARSGNAFVVYDTPMREVHAIAVSEKGTIFAAAMGEEGPQAPTYQEVGPKQAKPAQRKQQAANSDEVSLSPQSLVPSSFVGKTGERSALYRVDKDGAARDIWDSNRDRVQSFILQNDSVLIVGTGDDGKLYQLTTAPTRSLLIDMEENQITNLHKMNSEKILVCTSNMGRVYTQSPDTNVKGTYQSDVFDARVLANWGAISWQEKAPHQGDVLFYTRTGNTEEPNRTWSEWSRAYTNDFGDPISSPPARFIQWKCELKRSGKTSPTVQNVAIAYLQKNVAPIITDVIVHRQGKYYPANSNKQSSSNDLDGRQGIVFPSPLGEESTKKGYRTVDWLFEDANSDALQFDLYFKNEQQKEWTELAKDLSTNVYSWDSAQMPDGRYRIKVIAVDLPSNPRQYALEVSKVSEPFTVDNSGPQVESLSVQDRRKTMTFKVSDDWSIIRTVEISINSGGWEEVYPIDGICDSRMESFEVPLPKDQPVVRTVVVRAKDDLQNYGFGTVQREGK